MSRLAFHMFRVEVFLKLSENSGLNNFHRADLFQTSGSPLLQKAKDDDCFLSYIVAEVYESMNRSHHTSNLSLSSCRMRLQMRSDPNDHRTKYRISLHSLLTIQ